MKKLFKKVVLMVMALFTLSVATGTVREVKAAGTFTQATSLSAGDTIIFACKSKNVVAGELSSTSTTYLLKVDATFNATTVSTEGLSVKEYVVEANSSGQFAFKSGTQYLSWSSGNSAAFSSSAYYWNVSFDANGNAIVDSVSTSGRKLQYNASSPRFACYTSAQTAIQIYKLGEAVEITDETKVQSAADSLSINSEFMYNTVLPTTGANNTSILWTSNNSAIVVGNNGVATVTRGESDIAVTLTATITLNTTSITKDFSVIVKGIMENEPTINTEYKMMLTQENLGKDLYFAGAMDGYYFSTTESYNEATTIVLENAPYDGYYISLTNSNGNKKYINITVNGTYNNVTMDDVASSAWSYNSEYDTLTTKANGTSLFLGTYSTYNTISASNVSFLESGTNFPIHLVEVIEEDLEIKQIKENLNTINTYMSLAYEYTSKTETVDIPSVTSVTDELTRTLTGIESTSYAEWSGKTVKSSAVYAGQSAGGNESIQLRSNNSNSGIVTTTSGGLVRKITIKWNSNTANDRTLDVYGSNTAYKNPTELYNTVVGEKIGSIVCGTSTELTINGDYKYIGLRSNSGAMYIDSISIEWEVEGESTGETETKDVTTFSSSNFFIRCGADVALADIQNIDSYGVKVSTTKNEVYYYSSSDAWGTELNADPQYCYVVINLGDIINDVTKLTTKFTVEAFVEVDEEKYCSKNVKTYSVVDMVKVYKEEKNIQAVEHLYNYFVEEGLITSKEAN